MIRLAELSYHLTQGFLYKNISMFLDRGDKIGLTGKNGVGKSTLLKLIHGDISPTEGAVIREKNLKIGFLTQDLEIEKNFSAREYIERSNVEVMDLKNRLEFVNHALVSRTDYESEEYGNLVDEVTHLNDRLTFLDAHQFAERIEHVLKGLGFKPSEFDNMIGSFSGGWQMRIELAKLLVNNPDVLLIDEPTNHLDIVSIQWLEQYLKNYKGGLVLISHDKRFLDNVTNRTIEIANQRLYDYKCNYSKYLVLHAEELERTMQAKKNQDREIKRTEDLINKYRAKANKASFAQSLIKKLDKVERIEIDTIERKAFNLKFSYNNPSGRMVLDFKKINKVYGQKVIFRDMDLVLGRGEKVALLGPNGVGKSTLIKAITKEIDYQGEVEFGHNGAIGYFAQDSAEKLNGEKTVFETIDDIAQGEKRKDIRNILGAFLFSGEEIDKKVKVLSGGERTRLAICKLLFQDFNFLIMDEPTNHLDLNSKEILKDALRSYEGTILLVSHDRDFLEGLSNKIWEIQDGQIKTHYFGVNEFLERISGDFAETKTSSKAEKTVVQPVAPVIKSKEDKAQQKKLENQLKKVERDIEETEIRVKEKLNELESADFSDVEKYAKITAEYEAAKSNLDQLMASWEEVQLNLELIKD
jgi:ATP-binding cassette, subfamily F, member 3